MTTQNPVRDARYAMELSQADFATRAGVSLATIQRCERDSGLPTNWKTKRLVVAAMAPTPPVDAIPVRRKTRAEEDREDEEEARAKQDRWQAETTKRNMALRALDPPPMP